MIHRSQMMMAAAAWLTLVGAGWAGRPLAVDDADPVDPGLLETEWGGAYEEDGGDQAAEAAVGLTYGALPGWEFGLGFGVVRAKAEGESESGVADTVLAAKWRYAGADSAFRQALVPAVKIPTADEDKGLGSGETDYDLTWICSLSICETFGLHLNAGHAWIGDPAGESLGDIVHGGVAADWQSGESVQWVAEVNAEDEQASGADTLVAFTAGLRWMPRENLVVDVGAGAPIEGEGPDFAVTAGLTYTFGATGN